MDLCGNSTETSLFRISDYIDILEMDLSEKNICVRENICVRVNISPA